MKRPPAIGSQLAGAGKKQSSLAIPRLFGENANPIGTFAQAAWLIRATKGA